MLLGISVCYLCILLHACSAYTIPQCGSDGIFEISDTTAEVTVSCTGIWNDPVYLSIIRSDGTTKTIVSCSIKECYFDPNFRVVREDDVIHVIKKGNVQSRDTLAGTLKCGRLGYSSPVASCHLRVVYDAEDVENCITEVNKARTVSGSCQVNKMFASDGKYSCTWLRIPQEGRSSIFPGQMEVTSTFTENGQTYHRGLCSFAGHAMPTTAGHYGYTVKIDPGHGYSTGAGINIKPPEGDPNISHCPTQLVEGDTLNCTCHVSSFNPGSPPAVASWYPPPEISSSLVIQSVTRSQDGSVFTCRQYWGGYNTSFGQKAKYTLRVNSRSTVPSVTTSSVTEEGVSKETLAPSTAPWVTTSPVTERGVHEKTLGETALQASTVKVITEKAIPSTTHNSNDGDDTEPVIVIGVTGAVVGIAAFIIIAVVAVFCRKKRNSRPLQTRINTPDQDQNNREQEDYEPLSNQDPAAWPYQSLQLQPLPPRPPSTQQDEYVDATSSIKQSSLPGADYEII